MLKFFCNRSQKPAKGPWQFFLFTTDSLYWLELDFSLFLLITSALHSPQGRTYHRNRAHGRLYGITFLSLGRFEELLCCDEKDDINDAATCGLMRHWCKELVQGDRVLCCLRVGIFSKDLCLLTASIRVSGRGQLRVWWRAYARMLATKQRKFFVGNIKRVMWFHTICRSLLSEGQDIRHIGLEQVHREIRGVL